MRGEGSIRRWDAARGFGFIQTAERRDVFFHVRDFRGAGAPTEGLRVSFEAIEVGGKGPRAMDVRPLSATAGPAATTPAARPQPTAPRSASATAARARPEQVPSRAHAGPPPAPHGAALAWLLMLGWLGLLAAGAWWQRLPTWLLPVLVVLNLATYLAYAGDKRAAQRGHWRTPEQTLNLLAQLGGWPAAWWAQQWLRHKSRKLEFRLAYWVTVVLNCAALALLVARPTWLPAP